MRRTRSGRDSEPARNGARMSVTQMSAEARTGSQGPVSLSRETIRLLPIVVPVVLAGVFALAVAISSLAAAEPPLETFAGAGALLLAAMFVEAFPVPIQNVPVGGTSLANVFIVGTAVIYGWELAIVVGFLTQLVVELIRRQPSIRVLYNTCVYGLAGGAAGLVVTVVPNDGFGWLAFEVAAASTAFYAVNLPLIVVVVSRWARDARSHPRSSPLRSWPR
jgi:hypothetical protein